ncbi:MAG: hypothetical protein M5R36_22520 [Deltaproteobacteria bacterium]|nr:hypothetical protein [Deltaproteobacteria bacterium]
MKRALRALAAVMTVAFIAAVFPACKMPGSIDDAKNMSLGKYAQTVHVEKDELGKKISTQWGKISFSSSEQSKIKKLKKNKTKRFSVESSKGKNVEAVVTYLGKKRYQLAMTAL